MVISIASAKGRFVGSRQEVPSPVITSMSEPAVPIPTTAEVDRIKGGRSRSGVTEWRTHFHGSLQWGRPARGVRSPRDGWRNGQSSHQCDYAIPADISVGESTSVIHTDEPQTLSESVRIRPPSERFETGKLHTRRQRQHFLQRADLHVSSRSTPRARGRLAQKRSTQRRSPKSL